MSLDFPNRLKTGSDTCGFPLPLNDSCLCAAEFRFLRNVGLCAILDMSNFSEDQMANHHFLCWVKRQMSKSYSKDQVSNTFTILMGNDFKLTF